MIMEITFLTDTSHEGVKAFLCSAREQSIYNSILIIEESVRIQSTEMERYISHFQK
jgi:hypothetical protein